MTALNWVADSRRLQVATLDGKIREFDFRQADARRSWDLSRDRPTVVWSGHDSLVGAADGFGSAWCSEDGDIRRATFSPAVFGSACVSLERQELAVMEDAPGIALFGLPGLERQGTIPLRSPTACGLAYGDRGRILWAGDGSFVRAFDGSGREVASGRISSGLGEIHVVRPLLQDTCVAVGTAEGYVLVLDCSSDQMTVLRKRRFSPLNPMTFSIKAIAIVPGTSLLAIATTGQPGVALWDFRADCSLEVLSFDPDEPVSAIAFTADGSELAVGFRSGRVAVFSLTFQE